MIAQSRSEVLGLLERHGLRPRKAWGQHFLADRNIVAKIVDLAGVGAGDQVVEIGPGTGALTLGLAAAGVRVVGYEIDTLLKPLLAEVLAATEGVEVRFRDVTSVDLGVDLPTGNWVMVANLPYNVGTPLVLDVLREVPRITRLVVMVQEEVAERLAAAPGGKEYGLPSVVAQLHADVRLSFRVPPQVFVPPPNVGSAVVVMQRRPAPAQAERAVTIAAAAFGQRRKMLRRSLAGLVAAPRELLARAGIDEQRRAAELSPADYLRLAEVERG
jgi:16S rRNA (adenine1518-N6/adenine1519-N6)-dimethyltransferase